MTYQEAIKKLRSKMILSQMEFAEELGVSFVTVNRWETGKHAPTIKAKRLLKAYFEKYEIVYQLTMKYVKQMLEQKIITLKEYIKIDSELKEKYALKISPLFLEMS